MDTYQAVLVAALVFTVPGLLFNWVSGLKGPWAIAAAIPVTFGIYGLAAWLIGETGARFNVGTVLVVWAILMLLAFVWRGAFLVFRRRSRDSLAAAGKPSPEQVDDVVLPAAELISRPDDARAGGTGHGPGDSVVTAAGQLGAGEITAAETGARVRTAEGGGSTAVGTRRATWWSRDWRTGSLLDPVWLLPAGGVLVGMWLLISNGIRWIKDTTNGMENIFQGWDVHWHASVVRFIEEEGIASSTRMGELQNIETQAEMYYPTAWHAGAWLFSDIAGVSGLAAINYTAVVLAGMALPLSVALIAWRLINNRGLTAQIAAGLGGIAVVGAPVLFWVGHYVGAWPYLAAVAVSGIVIALFMLVPFRPPAIFAAALSLMGLAQLHPSAATIVVLAVGLWWLCHLVWAPARRGHSTTAAVGYRLRDLGLLAAAGLGGVVLLLPQLLSGAEQTEEVAAFSAEEDITHAEAWSKSFQMLTRHTDTFPEFSATVPLVLGAFGAIVLVVWRRNIWAPLFYFLSVALTVNALQPFAEPWGSWLNIIGSLHYSTAHRLVMPVAMFLFAAAAVGVAVLIRLVSLAPVRKWALGSTIASVVLALVMGGVTVVYSKHNLTEGAEWSITASRNGRMVSEVDLAAFDWLAQQPHAYDGLIMGEPADGHGWMYAYNALPSVNRHYQWPTTAPDDDTNMLYWHPHLIGAGNHGDPDQTNHVDLAAEDLGVNFFFSSPGNFWAFQEPNLAITEGLWQAPGLTAVYQHENVSIFAVNEAFTDEELAHMREPGNSPVPLGPVPTKGEMGRADTPEEADEPFFHRPTKPDLGGPAPDEPAPEPAPVN